jgi:hypothetical protein
MSETEKTTIAGGIDIGKNAFHVVGRNQSR